MQQVLIDTGPWVALIDRSEGKHDKCAQWFRKFKGEIFSTEAVLTEVLYLVNFSISAQEAAVDFVLCGAFILVPFSLNSLEHNKKLMRKYSDLPMDYADATLVSLAQELNIANIVTFDTKHFSAYRFSKTKTFHLCL
ncbi:MAG: PIN domain-containing protein [Pseudomonadota bacterium]